MFEVSRAKEQILEKLVERSWSPTDLARDLGKSTEAVYNHLNDLAEMGVLKKSKEKAKTRPKTVYSIGKGFVQYLAVLPGQFVIRTVETDENKKVLLRIWATPRRDTTLTSRKSGDRSERTEESGAQRSTARWPEAQRTRTAT